MDTSTEWEGKKLLGNVAENVVQFLIDSCPGWKCEKYGMENHIDSLKKDIKNNYDETSLRIRTMPDFIAVNKEEKKVVLVDVKYRSFIDKTQPGKRLYQFHVGSIKDYLEYWKDVSLIVVHRKEPYFRVIHIKDIKWHLHLYDREKGLWDFLPIEKDIKDLFPGISEDSMQKAIKNIPRYNEN